MPELPEVETVVRFLQPHILGKTISGVEFPWPKACAGLSISQFRKNVVGCKIRAVERRGKYIVFTIGSAWQPSRKCETVESFLHMLKSSIY